MATSVGQRGKYAEGKVKDYLQRVNETLAHFAFLRLPDARTAMGRGTSMPGDFEFFAPGLHGILEVKQQEGKTLLPAKNVSQLPAMKARTLAGGHCYIVVYHSTTKLWRLVPARDLEIKTTGSWDLSSYPTYQKLEDALPLSLLGG